MKAVALGVLSTYGVTVPMIARRAMHGICITMSDAHRVPSKAAIFVWRREMGPHRRSITTNAALELAKPGDNPLKFYKDQVSKGILREDPRQLAALVQLERVWKDFAQRNQEPPKSRGIMDWFSGSEPQEGIKGLYLYGGVGCGKTFVMDLFYACVPIEKKRRSHFHSFMLEIHQRLHLIRKSGKGRADVATVAEDVVRESGELFCFDEFNVTDVRSPRERRGRGVASSPRQQ